MVRPQVKASPAARVWGTLSGLVTSSPARFALTVFIALIALFTFLFSLPIATATGEQASFTDALFSAVTVICVTGLTTVDMATYWSPFGHLLIFLGTQIGGVGVLTMASILGLIVSRRLGLKQTLIAAGDVNPMRFSASGARSEAQAVRLSDTKGLLRTVAISMLVIEATVAVLLLPRMLLAGEPFLDSLWHAVFLAGMAFTNTGITPYSEGLAQFSHDPYFLIVLMVAVVLGAIGFPVIYSLTRTLFRPRAWSLHVRLTLVTFGILLVAGWLAILGLEWDNPATIGGEDFGQKLLQSAFVSVNARSGGLATIDIGQMEESSLLVGDMLMFVGGGSASTAGGIKVTTFAVLLLAAIAEARGRDDMETFRRRIPIDVLRLAVAVTLWGATVVAATTVTLLILTNFSLEDVIFDAISAFATVGLSTGFTENAPDAAQLVLAVTMFLGRVGTVTFAAALAARQHVQLFRRPEERPIVG